MSGTAGRYKTRYGKRIRDKISKIEKEGKVKQKCQNCGSKSLKRLSTGIWYCKKCKNKFSGGTWKPKTGAEKLIRKAVKKQRR